MKKKILRIFISSLLAFSMVPATLPLSIPVFAETTTPVDLSKASVLVQLEKTAYSYTGEKIEPAVISVKVNSKDLNRADNDYTVSYGENVKVGKGTVVINAGANEKYTGSKTVEFNITKASPKITISGESNKDYDGQPLNTPSYSISPAVNSEKVSAKWNTKDGSAPKDHGNYSYTVTVKGDTNVNDASQTLNTSINTVDIMKCGTPRVDGTFTYTGSDIKPEVSGLVYNGYHLAKDTDYTLTYRNNREKTDNAIARITGKGNFTGYREVTFKIGAADIAKTDLSSANIQVSDIQTQKYTGKGIEPKPTVTLVNGNKKTVLVLNRDYTLEYNNNTNPGTSAQVIIKAKDGSSYTGRTTKSFVITNVSLVDCTYTTAKDVVYTGEAIDPDITIKNGNVTLQKGTDYTFEYAGDHTNAGRVLAYVKPGSNRAYTGGKDITFKITPRSISGTKLYGVENSYNYDNGNAVLSDVDLYSSYDNRTKLVKDQDYTLSFNPSTFKPGRVTLTVTGKGNYTGALTKTFTITDGSNKEGISIAKAVISDISDLTYTGSELKPSVSVNLEGRILRSGTDYTVSYTNNINFGSGTVEVKGKGDYSGTITKTFRINQAPISSANVSGLNAQKYTGGPVTPILGLSYNGKSLVRDIDYKLIYHDNTEKGNGHVTITGINNFTGTVEKTFPITEKGSEDAEKVWATSFTLPNQGSLLPGATQTLNPALTPENANTYTIRWNTSNPDFVFVDGSTTNTAQTTDSKGAVVRANKEGSTVITAELFDENSKSLGKQYTLVRTIKSFSDVGNDYSTNAINSLANYGYVTGSGATQEYNSTPVINGTSPNTFTPSGDVKRADFVLMLYNKAVADYQKNGGTDPSKATAAGFKDVASDAYYASAINWAVANGIAQGKGNNTFDPNGTVTRAEAVTFLQRYLKGANGSTTKFTDVSSGAYYAGAVGWAVANGVTDGISATTFSPNVKCNRAQAATFIYRAAF